MVYLAIKSGKRTLSRFCFLPILLFLFSCVSARMTDHSSDRFFRRQDFDQAALSLEAGLKKQGENGRDLLLYLLDLGLTYHTSGRYEESNRYFMKADKIAEIKDYTSIATEGATLITSENLKDYKGEDFEKVLINTYLSLNFALLGNYESALVEARRVNRKLYMMVTEGGRKYQQSAFARYFSGALYEAEKQYNDAYIDYKKAAELIPDFPEIGNDLWRVAYAAGFQEDLKDIQDKYSLSKDDCEKQKNLVARKTQLGEILVVYQNGISPIKRPHPSWYAIPKFYPRYNPVSYAQIKVGQIEKYTAILDSVEQMAIQNLEEKWGGLLAKKVAGVVTKEIVAYQIERMTDNPLLGLIAKLVMYLSDQADLRSWNLLPRDIQMARIVVPAGLHTVKISPLGDFEGSMEKTVQVLAGQKAIVNFRYTPY